MHGVGLSCGLELILSFEGGVGIGFIDICFVGEKVFFSDPYSLYPWTHPWGDLFKFGSLDDVYEWVERCPAEFISP